MSNDEGMTKARLNAQRRPTFNWSDEVDIQCSVFGAFELDSSFVIRPSDEPLV
jgi:hypothetical protein